jgi:tRNA threonylcarbamoyladenosine biosynthesis protein TsaE
MTSGRMWNNGLNNLHDKSGNRLLISHSDNETLALGRELGQRLTCNSVVCFFGDLAAGKTTFIKGLVEGAAGYPQENVSSPTFVFLNIYQGQKVIYHFDLYRLQGIDEFLSMGFDEFFTADGICCIEWSERIESLLPPNCIRIMLKHMGDDTRHILIEEI